MSAPATQRAAEATTSQAQRPSALRLVGAVAGVAAILSIAGTVGVGGFVAFLFGSVFGAVLLLIVAVVAATAISFMLKLASGRHHIVLAIASVVAAAVLATVAVLDHGIPVWWTPWGFDLVYVVIGIAVAVVTGLFIGPRWARVVGALIPIVIVATLVWQSAQQSAAAREEEERAAAARAEEDFESYLSSGVHPMVTDLAGAEVASVSSGTPAISRIVVASGGVVDVSVNHWSSADSSTKPCLWLAWPGYVYDETQTLEEMSAFCVQEGEEWRRPDGLALARIDGDRLIAVTGVHDEQVDGVEPPKDATPAEIDAVFHALQPMTEAEMREQFAAEWGVVP